MHFEIASPDLEAPIKKTGCRTTRLGTSFPTSKSTSAPHTDTLCPPTPPFFLFLFRTTTSFSTLFPADPACSPSGRLHVSRHARPHLLCAAARSWWFRVPDPDAVLLRQIKTTTQQSAWPAATQLLLITLELPALLDELDDLIAHHGRRHRDGRRAGAGAGAGTN